MAPFLNKKASIIYEIFIKIEKLTVRDSEISKAAERYYKENPVVQEKFGRDEQLSPYIKKAMSQSEQCLVTEFFIAVGMASMK